MINGGNMNKGSLILVIISLFVIGFVLGGITGKATKEEGQTTVLLNPTTIEAGDSITIKVNPGSKGVGAWYNVYRENAAGHKSRLGGIANEFCRGQGSTCTKTVTFDLRTLKAWKPGIYFVEFYPKDGGIVKEYFTIV